jgi:Domain of unknown function (DUF4193)
MSATERDPEYQDFEEEPDDLLEVDDEDEDEDALDVVDEDEEEETGSLDEMLASRSSVRRNPGTDYDEDISLASGHVEDLRGPVATKVIPVKQRQEFVCTRCRLVKAKSQLADPQRGLCRDCV